MEITPSGGVIQVCRGVESISRLNVIRVFAEPVGPVGITYTYMHTYIHAHTHTCIYSEREIEIVRNAVKGELGPKLEAAM